ncbi:MAG: hypothetical protein FWF10_11380 [Clostridiales bacterium]|nr:hypothetical protein [Clostridiales bacterium]
MNWNGTDYYYLRNGQGDIVALIDASGIKVVEYQYDTWGNPIAITGTLASTLGELNPFRYRGYIYDSESALPRRHLDHNLIILLSSVGSPKVRIGYGRICPKFFRLDCSVIKEIS